MRLSLFYKLAAGAGAAALVGAALHACAAPGPRTSNLVTGDAASRVYVPPGSYDEFYAFLSGG